MNEFFKRIQLFNGIDAKTLAQAALYFGTPKTYGTDRELMAAGAKTNDVFFLIEGKVRLSLFSPDGGLISYREVVPYDYFGWLSALDSCERLTSAIAIEPAKAFVLKAAKFQELLLSDPRIHSNFVKRVGGVVRRYTARIQELTLFSARQRIMRELDRRFGEDK